MSSNPEGAKRSLPFVIIGGVLVAVIVAVFLMSRQSGNSNATAQSNAGTTAANTLTPRTPLPGAPGPHVRGPENAPVTLEEFGDFECPACGGLDPAMRRISKDYGERVRLIFREFPLQMHKYSFIAARAAEAAGLQGKFWEMHDMLYDHQDDWKDAPEPRDIFNNYAAQLGLDVERFKADLNRQDLADRIKQDYDRGVSLNVRGTPTIFVNGQELMPGKLPTEQDIRRAIDATLAASGK
ncbi:MAG TPA: thioredoxin domain-containing protein [Pyrinomonadaceae bacterium]|nr:thioredoxin domain-containing protein [Pyrinomonadaceae bacterium]